MRFVRTVMTCVLALAGTAAAQIRPGDAGFRMVAPKSGTQGTLCRGFSCTATPASAFRGETVTLEVRGKINGPFVIALATRAGLCIKIEPFFHNLVVAPSAVIVPGVMDIQDTIRACPGGIGRVRFSMPQLATSYRVSMQALAESFGNGPGRFFAFTQALDVRVL